jgi:transcriptional regulator GlxA family with amidase domain
MRIAILLFDRVTALDAIGPYQVFSSVPGDEVVFVGERVGPVRSHTGRLGLLVDQSLDQVATPDVVVVPGGPGQADHMTAGPVRDWLHTVDRHTTWTTSVCTGSLILAGAGLLAGRRATTHWAAMAELEPFGVTPVRERTVIDGKYATAAGVSAGIDLALTLTGRMHGDELAQRVQLGIEYDPRPPYRAGSPDTAPADLVADYRARARFRQPA